MQADFTEMWYPECPEKGAYLWAKEAGRFSDLKESLEITTGRRRLNAPLQLEIVEGRRPGAQLYLYAAGLRVFSRAFYDALASAHCTGWANYPVSINGLPAKVDPNNYFGLIATGRAGPPDYSLSARATRLPRVPGGKPTNVLAGLLFAPDSWDGSDVFLMQGTGYLVLTSRAKRALESAGLRDPHFTRLDCMLTPALEMYTSKIAK